MKYHPRDEISTLTPAWRAAGAGNGPLDSEKKCVSAIFFRLAERVGADRLRRGRVRAVLCCLRVIWVGSQPRGSVDQRDDFLNEKGQIGSGKTQLRGRNAMMLDIGRNMLVMRSRTAQGGLLRMRLGIIPA